MRKGFSLIELVVVMGILGTLIGIGVSSYTSSLNKSRDARRKADLHEIQIALEQYKNANGSYPETGWVNSKDGGTTWIPNLTSDYIKTLPIDPVNVVAAAPGAPDQTGNYVYGYYSQDDLGGACSGLKGGEYYILGTRLESLSDHDAGQTMVTSACSWPSSVIPGVYALSNP